MDLRTLVPVLKRRPSSCSYPVLVVPIVAYGLSSRQTKRYDATAEVLLKPNNPDEGVDTVGGNNTKPDEPRPLRRGLRSASSRAPHSRAAVADEIGADADALRRRQRRQKGPATC